VPARSRGVGADRRLRHGLRTVANISAHHGAALSAVPGVNYGGGPLRFFPRAWKRVFRRPCPCWGPIPTQTGTLADCDGNLRQAKDPLVRQRDLIGPQRSGRFVVFAIPLPRTLSCCCSAYYVARLHVRAQIKGAETWQPPPPKPIKNKAERWRAIFSGDFVVWRASWGSRFGNGQASRSMAGAAESGGDGRAKVLRPSAPGGLNYRGPMILRGRALSFSGRGSMTVGIISFLEWRFPSPAFNCRNCRGAGSKTARRTRASQSLMCHRPPTIPGRWRAGSTSIN